jgi:hypothetical protein
MGFELDRLLDRKREMMLDMEKPCSDDLVGTKTAMLPILIQNRMEIDYRL